MEPTATDITSQDQRTFLRERFLRMWALLPGKTANIYLHQKTCVSCVLGAADIDITHLQVSELQTPLGTMPDAMIRTSDIQSITVAEDVHL